jgi:hypothetical protein
MVKKEAFGTTPDGKAVDLYTLTNTHGVEVRVMTYGAVVVSIKTPDKKGSFADITLGFDSLSGYRIRIPISGPSSDVMEIGSVTARSSSKARSTRWLRTTVLMPCTGG